MKNVRVMLAVSVLMSVVMVQAARIHTDHTSDSAANATKSSKLSHHESKKGKKWKKAYPTALQPATPASKSSDRPGEDGAGEQHLLGTPTGNGTGYKKIGDNETAVDHNAALASYHGNKLGKQLVGANDVSDKVVKALENKAAQLEQKIDKYADKLKKAAKESAKTRLNQRLDKARADLKKIQDELNAR